MSSSPSSGASGSATIAVRVDGRPLGTIAPSARASVAVVAPMPEVAPPPITGVAGLQSREPDACHAANYRSAIGQPASVIPTLGITRQYRVAEYRGIEPEEYNALRIAFQLDAAGNIAAVTCG